MFDKRNSQPLCRFGPGGEYVSDWTLQSDSNAISKAGKLGKVLATLGEMIGATFNPELLENMQAEIEQQADAIHRLTMLKHATETDLRFSVSDIELQRGGISYTIDTLQESKADHQDSELFLIVGSDTLVELHTWHEIDELLGLCEIASFVRPGEDSKDLIEQKKNISDKHKDRVLRNVIEAHRIDISSTDIRMRIAKGLSIRYLVPAEVERYIYEQGLYQG